MNIQHKINKQTGFTLIEVMMALVIAVVGILAMVQLSSTFLQTTSESDQRAVATTLAERTLENLRGFDTLSGGASSFTDIATASAAVTVSSGIASYNFVVDWDVTDFAASGAGFSSAATGSPTETYKDITVTVSWTEPQAGSISLSTIIGGIDPQASALSFNDSSLGGSEPKVDYTPGVAPEVVAIDVGDGKKKETTKPVPEVAHKDYSTEVTFETITYDDTGTEFKLVQEDYLTVNCICNLSTAHDTVISPAYQEYDNSLGTIVEHTGRAVSGGIGTEGSLGGGNSQSDYCERCCTNHHDSADSTVKYSPDAGNAADGEDHRHYKVTNDATDPLTLAVAGDGEDYLEACRFKRINGFYQLVQDWRLLEVNVVPSTYLVSGASGLTDYVSYVQDYVKWHLYNVDLAASAATAQKNSAAKPSLTTTPELTLDTTGDDQALSRAIYLDDPTTVVGLADYLLGLDAASISENTMLQYIPFNEINTSELSEWSSNDDTVAIVSNQAIADNYSRGLIEAVALGTTSVPASVAQGNTGILGNSFSADAPSNYQEKDNRITTTRTWVDGTYNPMTVTVSGAGAGGTTYSITLSGNIYHDSTPGKDYAILCTASVGTIANPTLSQTAGEAFSCTISDIPTGSTTDATVTFSAHNSDAECSTDSFNYNGQNSNVTGIVFYVADRSAECLTH